MPGELVEESYGTEGEGRQCGKDLKGEGVAKTGRAGLELCSGKQIPKVAWRGWLKVDKVSCRRLRGRVRMTQLGSELVCLGDELTVARTGRVDCAPSTASPAREGLRWRSEA